MLTLNRSFKEDLGLLGDLFIGRVALQPQAVRVGWLVQNLNAQVFHDANQRLEPLGVQDVLWQVIVDITIGEKSLLFALDDKLLKVCACAIPIHLITGPRKARSKIKSNRVLYPILSLDSTILLISRANARRPARGQRAACKMRRGRRQRCPQNEPAPSLSDLTLDALVHNFQ